MKERTMFLEDGTIITALCGKSAWRRRINLHKGEKIWFSPCDAWIDAYTAYWAKRDPVMRFLHKVENY